MKNQLKFSWFFIFTFLICTTCSSQILAENDNSLKNHRMIRLLTDSSTTDLGLYKDQIQQMLLQNDKKGLEEIADSMEDCLEKNNIKKLIVRIHLEEEDLTDAEKTTNTIKDPQTKTECLLFISRKYRQIKKSKSVLFQSASSEALEFLKKAENTAKTIKVGNFWSSTHDFWPRDMQFIHLTEEYIKNGKLEEAERIANKIKNTDSKGARLSEIVRKHIHMGDLNKAEKIAKAIEDYVYQADTLKDIIAAYIKVQKLSDAKRIAAFIEDEWEKINAFGDIAQEYLKCQQVDQSQDILYKIEKIADRIKKPYDKVRILISDVIDLYLDKLSGILSKNENLKRVRKFLSQIDKLTASIEDPDDRIYFLAQIAKRYIQIHDLNKAEELLQKAENIAYANEDAYGKMDNLIQIANKYTRLQKLDHSECLLKDAEKLNVKIEDSFDRNFILPSLVKGYVKTGNFLAAERVIFLIDNPLTKVKNLILIGNKIPDKIKENLVKSQEIASDIKDLREQVEALVLIAREYLKIQDLNLTQSCLSKAWDVLKDVQDEKHAYKKAQSVVAIAKVYIEMGKFDPVTDLLIEAEQNAWLIDSTSNGKILYNIVKGYLKIQNIQEAERIASMIEYDLYQTLSSKRIIEEYLKTQDFEAACKCTALIDDPYEQTAAYLDIHNKSWEIFMQHSKKFDDLLHKVFPKTQ